MYRSLAGRVARALEDFLGKMVTEALLSLHSPILEQSDSEELASAELYVSLRQLCGRLGTNPTGMNQLTDFEGHSGARPLYITTENTVHT